MHFYTKMRRNCLKHFWILGLLVSILSISQSLCETSPASENTPISGISTTSEISTKSETTPISETSTASKLSPTIKASLTGETTPTYETSPTSDEDVMTIEDFERNKHLFLNISQPETSTEEIQQSDLDEYLNTRITEQFGQITNKLSDLIYKIDEPPPLYGNVLSQNLGQLSFSYQSSPVLGRRNQCSVSLDKLKALKQEFITPNYQEVHCKTTQIDTDNCKELLKFIQCSIKNLKASWEAVSKSGSTESITKWKKAFFTLSENYQKEIDNIKQSMSQKYARESDELKQSLQDLAQSLKISLQHLKDSRFMNCIYEIALGKYAKAVATFQYMNDADSLRSIIRSTYSEHGKRMQIKNIHAFLKALKNCSHIKVGYTALYDVMAEFKEPIEEFGTIHTKYVARCLARVIKPCTSNTPLSDKQFLRDVFESTTTLKTLIEMLREKNPQCHNYSHKYCEWLLTWCPFLPIPKYKGYVRPRIT